MRLPYLLSDTHDHLCTKHIYACTVSPFDGHEDCAAALTPVPVCHWPIRVTALSGIPEPVSPKCQKSLKGQGEGRVRQGTGSGVGAEVKVSKLLFYKAAIVWVFAIGAI